MREGGVEGEALHLQGGREGGRGGGGGGDKNEINNRTSLECAQMERALLGVDPRKSCMRSQREGGREGGKEEGREGGREGRRDVPSENEHKWKGHWKGWTLSGRAFSASERRCHRGGRE